MIIERASEHDLPAILALQRRAYVTEAELYGDYSIPPLVQTEAEIAEELAGAVFLKAVEGDEIIGSVRARCTDGTCHVGRLIVDQSWRRRGIGTALIRAIEASFPAACRFELFTGDRSVENQRLYRRLGYVEIRRAPLAGDVVLVFMQKPGPGAVAAGA